MGEHTRYETQRGTNTHTHTKWWKMWEHFDGVECANDSDLLLEEICCAVSSGNVRWFSLSLQNTVRHTLLLMCAISTVPQNLCKRKWNTTKIYTHSIGWEACCVTHSYSIANEKRYRISIYLNNGFFRSREGERERKRKENTRSSSVVEVVIIDWTESIHQIYDSLVFVRMCYCKIAYLRLQLSGIKLKVQMPLLLNSILNGNDKKRTHFQFRFS